MVFITCFKIAVGKAQEAYQWADRWLAQPPAGIKVLGTYLTLGRYDAVWLLEAASEREVVKALQSSREVAVSETMVAVPRAEIRKTLA
ncbi:MAG: hypothetical protein HYZ73_01210 [Elusimicrobia bacterium]|nr:hypothetical protein [Elusimicrobiota bacterium]